MVDGENAVSENQDANPIEAVVGNTVVTDESTPQTPETDWQAVAVQAQAAAEKMQAALDDAVTGLDEVNRQLASVTAERDALKAAAEKAAAAPKSARVQAAKARKCGPMDNPKSDDLLLAISAAEKVEVVFSDGKAEVAALSALSVSGNAWRKVMNGVQLALPSLIVDGPGPGTLEVAGYGLFLDGKQAGWAARMEVLRIPVGWKLNLTDDVLFAPGEAA